MVIWASLSDLIALLTKNLPIIVIKVIHHVLLLRCSSHWITLLLMLLLNKFLIGGLKRTDTANSRRWCLMLASSFLSFLIDLRVFTGVINIVVWSWWLLKGRDIVVPFFIINHGRLWTDKSTRVRISGHFSWRIMMLRDIDLRVTVTLWDQMRGLLVYQCETVWITIACRFRRQFGHLEISIHIRFLELAFYFQPIASHVKLEGRIRNGFAPWFIA